MMKDRRRRFGSFDYEAFSRVSEMPLEKPSQRMSSLDRTQSVSIRLRSVVSNCPIVGLSSRQLSSLFQARCKDLGISQVPDQEARFVKTCLSTIKNRRFVLNNLQLSLRSSVAISKILADSSAFFHIDLSCNSLGDRGSGKICKGILKNRTIVHLSLSSNNLSAEGSGLVIKSLRKHPSLVSLDLSSVETGLRNKVCPLGARELGKSLSWNGILTHINLSNTLICNKSFDHIVKGLESNTHLVSLHLASNYISHVKDFAKVLPKTNIESLNIADNLVGDLGCKYLAKALVEKEDSRPVLSHIDLSGNSITHKGLAYFLSGIQRNIKINTVKLNDNDFSDGMSAEFVDCLQQSFNLETLSLANCKISDLGFLSVCNGIAVNSSLKNLNIAKNNFTINTNIVSALKANSTLHKLNLSGNNIKEKHMQYIINMIRDNRGLNHLNLSENKIRTESVALLIEACRANSQIYSINLDPNAIDPGVLNKIEDVLKKNHDYYQNNIVPKLKTNIQTLKIDPCRIDAVKCQTQRAKRTKKSIEIKINNIKIEDIKYAEEEKTLQIHSERSELEEKFRESCKSLTDLLASKKVKEARYKVEERKMDRDIDKIDHDLTQVQQIKNKLIKTRDSINHQLEDNTKDLREELAHEQRKLETSKNILEMLKKKLEMKKESLDRKTKKKPTMFLASAKLVEVKREGPYKVRQPTKLKPLAI